MEPTECENDKRSKKKISISSHEKTMLVNDKTIEEKVPLLKEEIEEGAEVTMGPEAVAGEVNVVAEE